MYNKIKTCIFTFILGLALTTSSQSADTKHISLLTIGNSFSNNATHYLPDIVEADPTCQLTLQKASIGGCPLDKHVRLFKEAEKDPSQKHYWYTTPEGRKHYNLKEMLQAQPYDIVTIQQLSIKSPDIETYYPYAPELYDYVKKNAPQAAVWVHQTWSYRTDHPLFQKPDNSQQIMYDRLTKNYRQIAKELNCKILPSGAAMQLAREKQTPKFIFPDPQFDYKNPTHPNLPNQTGSLIRGHHWRKNKDTEQMEFKSDLTHANTRGEFLQALVWYEMLFGKDARKNTFKPKNITDDDAQFLRTIAHETVQTFAQEVQ